MAPQQAKGPYKTAGSPKKAAKRKRTSGKGWKKEKARGRVNKAMKLQNMMPEESKECVVKTEPKTDENSTTKMDIDSPLSLDTLGAVSLMVDSFSLAETEKPCGKIFNATVVKPTSKRGRKKSGEPKRDGREARRGTGAKSNETKCLGKRFFGCNKIGDYTNYACSECHNSKLDTNRILFTFKCKCGVFDVGTKVAGNSAQFFKDCVTVNGKSMNAIVFRTTSEARKALKQKPSVFYPSKHVFPLDHKMRVEVSVKKNGYKHQMLPDIEPRKWNQPMLSTVDAEIIKTENIMKTEIIVKTEKKEDESNLMSSWGEPDFDLEFGNGSSMISDDDGDGGRKADVSIEQQVLAMEIAKNRDLDQKLSERDREISELRHEKENLLNQIAQLKNEVNSKSRENVLLYENNARLQNTTGDLQVKNSTIEGKLEQSQQNCERLQSQLEEIDSLKHDMCVNGSNGENWLWDETNDPFGAMNDRNM